MIKNTILALIFLSCTSCKQDTAENIEPMIEKPQVEQTLEKIYYFTYLEAREPRLDIQREQYSTHISYRIYTDTVDYCSPIKMLEGEMSEDRRTMLRDEYENEIQQKIDNINSNLYRNLSTSNWTRPEIKEYEGKISEGKLYKFDNYTEASEARHYFLK